MKKNTSDTEVHPAVVPIVAAFADDRQVTVGKMFGSFCLKVGGKVFAMVVKGNLVVKLPKERVAAIVASGKGEYFDPGHGRVMKEWVAVADEAKKTWLGLAEEAKQFVAAR